MRSLFIMVLVFLMLSLGTVFADAPPAKDKEKKAETYSPKTDPILEARAALRFLEEVDNEDRIYIRLGSIYSVPEKDRKEFVRRMKIWWRQLTLNPNRRSLPAPIPHSDTVFWFDLRSFNWNVGSWNAVAQRDKTFREPWIPSSVAERLRLLIGEKQPENFHVIAIVDLRGLYRRTYQTVETSDYYDLLFSKQRFAGLEGEGEKRDILINVGDRDNPKWEIQTANFYRRKFVDFPKTDKEWISALLGNIKEEEYQKTIKDLKSRRGAVCRGMEDVRIGGSGVARNNRIAWVAPVLTRIGAIYGETFDVVKTAGKRDLEENAFTDQDRDKDRVFKDGGELLFSLPAGDGNATLLVNAKGERVEEVPGRIAIHLRDPRDRAVRNGGMACMACHADAYGWIPLNNVIEKKIPAEIDLHFRGKNGKKDRQAAEDFDAFFLGWQDGLTGVRATMQAAWAESTGTKEKGYKDGYTGIEVGQWSLEEKWSYDDPVSIEQQCRETGLPIPLLRIAASKLTLIKTAETALKADIPRSAWDEDVFPEIMKVASSTKEILEGKLKPAAPIPEK